MSLHQLLRSETRDAHDRIEAAFDLEASLASPSSYAELLGRLLSFHAGFEQEAERWLAGTPLAGCLGRSALLRRDLAALDAPGRDVWPTRPYGERAEALGALYVLEGSLLGGVLIAREVERRLSLSRETGNSFFSGHGRDTARTWRAFCADLDALCEPGREECALAAARATYGSMQECLTRRAALATA